MYPGFNFEFKYDCVTYTHSIFFSDIYGAIETLKARNATGTIYTCKGCEIRVIKGAANLADVAIWYSRELS